MEEKLIGIGVIGCGSRMKYILGWLLDLGDKYKIVALCDPDEKAIDDYRETFGSDIKIYNNHEELSRDPLVDWVFVGSVNNVHKDQIVSAFKAGKNVFSEKPLAVDVSGCKEIKEMYEGKKPLFFISYPLRFSPHYRRIKELINLGKIGEVVSMEFNEVLRFNHGANIMTNWRRFTEISGGHLLEKCCHDIDLANWITESTAKKLASFGGLNFFKPENKHILEKMEGSKSKEEMDSYRNWKSNPFLSDKDVVDNQVVIIEYKNGIRATLHTNCSSGLPERRMYICGTEGSIRADVLTGIIELRRIGPNEETIEIIDEEIKGGHGGGDKFLVQALSNALLGGKIQGDQMNDAVKSAVTAITIDEARKSESVIDMTSIWESLNLK